MVTEAEMYWLTRLTGLNMAVFAMGIALSTVFAIAMFVGIIIWSEEDEKKILNFSVPCLVLSLLIAVSSIFIPTTKEMCVIKLVPKIVNDESVQDIPDKVVELANEWLNELKPRKEDD